uniref:Uncharacterized protein n=1 Tax=Plectus sambesii TaxID=2011161 RepID=A0A914UWF5_9BILA
MRAPVDVMTSAACVDFKSRSPPWNATDDLTAQGDRLDQYQASSYAKWRENAAQKKRENEEHQCKNMGKNTPEISHLRQIFLEGTAKKRAESQSKAKQEQVPVRPPVCPLPSSATKLDANYTQHHTASTLPTAPLTHFEESGKVSPRARARTQDRKRKLPAAEEPPRQQQPWMGPANTFHYPAPSTCMQPAYFAMHSQQMSLSNGIGPTDNICEDSLHRLMASNCDSNFHSVNLEDIDRVLFDAERPVDPRLLLEAKQQDDHLPLGASSSSLQYEAGEYLRFSVAISKRCAFL